LANSEQSREPAVSTPRLEAELRVALRQAAAPAPCPGENGDADPWDQALAALRRSRHRRVLAGLLAAALAVVAAALTVTLVAVAIDDITPSSPGAGGAASADVTTWPTRGDLAGRGDLVSRVRAVVGSRQPVLSVPFLGNLQGLAVAIVVTQGDLEQEISVLYGPSGDPVTSWSRQDGVHRDTPELPVLSAAIDDGTGLVHVVALTTTTGTVRLAWSPTAVMDADGFLRRRYTELPLTNGVGVVAAWGDVASFALRASTTSRIIVAPFTVTAGRRAAVAFPSVHGSRAASCRSSPLPSTLGGAVATLAEEGYVRLADVRRADLVWCRSEAGHDRMLVAVTAVGGAAVQLLVDGTRSGMGGYWRSVRSCPVPPGRAATYPFTMVADEDAFPDRGPLRVVVSAPGAARAEIAEAGSSRIVASAGLDAEGYGIAVVPAPERHLYLRRDRGLTLLVRDGAGRETQHIPARRPGEDDPWGQHLDGPVSAAG
jgi:hypothetical protein